MNCPYIVTMEKGKPVMVPCPDPSQKCWSCHVGKPAPARSPRRFYEEQS